MKLLWLVSWCASVLHHFICSRTKHRSFHQLTVISRTICMFTLLNKSALSSNNKRWLILRATGRIYSPSPMGAFAQPLCTSPDSFTSPIREPGNYTNLPAATARRLVLALLHVCHALCSLGENQSWAGEDQSERCFIFLSALSSYFQITAKFFNMSVSLIC